MIIPKDKIHRMLATRDNMAVVKYIEENPGISVSDLIESIEENYDVQSSTINLNKQIELSMRCIKINSENYIAMTHGYCLKNGSRVRSSILITDGGPRCHIRKSVYTDETKNDYFLLTTTVTTGGTPNRPQPGNWEVLKQWDEEGICKIKNSPRFMTIEDRTFVSGTTGSINVTNYWRNFYYGHFGYVAHIDKVYSIVDDKKIQTDVFKDLCSTGLFNQWEYTAPLNRLTDANDDPLPYPEILLCRVYKINTDISRDNLVTFDVTKQSRYWDELYDDEFNQRDVVISYPVIPDREFREMTVKLESVLNKYNALG